MYMHDAAWLSLAVALTLLGALITWLAARRGRTAGALTAAGLTLLPMALYLTGLLRLVAILVDQAISLLVGFAFSPIVWVGSGLGGVAFVLIAAGRMVRHRQREAALAGGPAPQPKQVGRTPTKPAAAPVDDEFADIEALLKRRGIE